MEPPTSMGATKMQNYTVTVASKPRIKKALLEFKIKLDDATSDQDAVAFNNDIDKLPEFKDLLTNLSIGDTVAFVGFENFNNYKGCKEIVIKSPDISRNLTYEEAMAIPSPDLIPVEERTMPDRKYTYFDKRANKNISFWSDGIYAWIEGQKDKKQKMTYKFLDEVNKHMIDNHWLLPDWYSLEQIKVMQADPLQLQLMEEFATY